MIIDNLTNLTKYVALNRSFQTVIDYLKANDLKSMEPGHYPIDGDNIFVNIQEGFGKTKDEAKVECHHEMIDILPLVSVGQPSCKPCSELSDNHKEKVDDRL